MIKVFRLNSSDDQGLDITELNLPDWTVVEHTSIVYDKLTLIQLVAFLANVKRCNSTQLELSNEYQHDLV